MSVGEQSSSQTPSVSDGQRQSQVVSCDRDVQRGLILKGTRLKSFY